MINNPQSQRFVKCRYVSSRFSFVYSGLTQTLVVRYALVVLVFKGRSLARNAYVVSRDVQEQETVY